MTAPTYLFYDIETTGLNKCFDQVLQFAAIRTDENLNEISRENFKIRLNKDVIPSPSAMITHRIRLQDCMQGVSELNAVEKIHALMNEPGTISLGYNTLGFDDEFLRFSFYRNLLPPYTHQYANQCKRMDLYPIAALFFLFHPEIIQWPKNGEKISLKLADLNTVNQLAPGNAHDAIVDVEATLALARCFFQNKKMWDYACGFFDKTIEQTRLSKLPTAFEQYDHRVKEALLISPKLGSDLFFQAPVLLLGPHMHYKNQQVWLRLDASHLQKLKVDNVDEESFVFRKRAAEPPFLLPTELRFTKYLSPERIALAEKNKAWLAEHPNQWKLLCEYHQHFKYPEVPNVDLDAALYQRDFPTPQDLRLFSEFHRADVSEKLKIAARFPDILHQEQAIRIVGRENPALLPPDALEIFNQYCRLLNVENALVDYRNQSKLTAKKALEEIEQLEKTNLDAEQRSLLLELIQWIKELPLIS